MVHAGMRCALLFPGSVEEGVLSASKRSGRGVCMRSFHNTTVRLIESAVGTYAPGSSCRILPTGVASAGEECQPGVDAELPQVDVNVERRRT